MDRWDELLDSDYLQNYSHAVSKDFSGTSACVTGAGGFIGCALAKAIATASPRSIALLDHSEQDLYEIDSEIGLLAPAVPRRAVLGDVRNGDLLDEILGRAPVDVIFHAAAFKHVPLLEENPLAAMENNVFGTLTLARAAARHRVGRVLMISTDKAVAPRSVMGASKRAAELILGRHSDERSRMSSVRFGNVFGSRGSVFPLFQEQIARGGPVTVTDPGASRYFLTLQEAVGLVLSAARVGSGGEVFVPDLGEPLLVLDLAKRMVQRHRDKTGQQIGIEFIGLRPGDKLHERLNSDAEILQKGKAPNLRGTACDSGSAANLDQLLDELDAACRIRDLPSALKVLRQIVSDYQPSEKLLQLANAQGIESAR